MSLWPCPQCEKAIPVQKARSHCLRSGEWSFDYFYEGRWCVATPSSRASSSALQSPANHQTSQVIFNLHNFPPATGVLEDPPSFASPWEVFFDKSNIAAVYWELMEALYDCLNRSSKTCMLPEDWSTLSDITGDPTSDGIWTRIYNAQIQNNNVREADFALRQWLHAFGYTSLLGNRYEFGARKKCWDLPEDMVIKLVPDRPFPGATPLIDSFTLAQIFHLWILTDPDRVHRWINAILRHYKPRIWRERGDVPRWCLPETADPDAVSYLSICQWKLEKLWGKQAAAADWAKESWRLQGWPPEVQ